MMRNIAYIFFLFTCLTHVSYAIGDDFTVRLLVGSDTTPPSTPTSLIATPVAQTQIDLSWGASTDDFIFGGYQVFRDTIQIATTTLTTYSDSGLTASTTYSYFVTAFDAVFNYSSSSNIVSTSTFPITPTSTPTTTDTETTYGSIAPLSLSSFTITPSQHSVDLTWTTNRYAQFQLRWGRTTSYELGFLANQLFKKQHHTEITDLEPGTVYEYELVGYDNRGKKTILKIGRFTTNDAEDTVAPVNVSNLRAVEEGDSIRLSWINPSDADFSRVRIVRNYRFYPGGQYDGYLTYQGRGSAIVDVDAFLQSPTQYYTVFSYDKNGNVSSGAVISIHKSGSALIGDIESAPSLDFEFNFGDIEFLQKSVLITAGEVDADAPMMVRIAYEKLPEHLKTITVAFAHPDNPENIFTFLLRINKDKTFYEATIAPLVVEGMYPVSVSVFDFQTQLLVTAKGSLTVKHFASGEAYSEKPFLTTLAKYSEAATIVLAIVLFLLLYICYRIIIFVRRKQQKP